MAEIHCRFCNRSLSEPFVDLGMSPLSNAYLVSDRLNRMEPFYPLPLYVCPECFLVQLPAFETPERIFSDYAYFSSVSPSWLAHARAYVELMIGRFGFDASCRVVEVASNDGYLLQYFRQHGVPVLGIEPAANVAEVAVAAGIDTLVAFFGVETAERLRRDGLCADLLVGNNVLAHVPDINDFVQGLKLLLKPGGVITMEFPHLLQLLRKTQFDTIYHEHFSYLSLLTVSRIFAAHGLCLFDVEELPTHGGSLRIYACHGERPAAPSENLRRLRAREIDYGLDRLATYRDFAPRVRKVKRDLLQFLIEARGAGKTVAGYGAPAKGNTLLNYCGIRGDLLDYTVDLSPHKQGHFLPGTHMPIHSPERIRQTRPDYLLVLPWNLEAEIVEQMAFIREWGGRFVLPIPELRVVP